MDYKEKYNKLVEAVKVLQETNPSDEGIQNWVNDNVPELAESEDDRIRKFISNELACLRASDEKGSDRYEELTNAIAWLEKQGTSYTKRDVDDAYVEGMAFTKDELEKQKPTWSEDDETGWTNTMIMIKECASFHYTRKSVKLVIDWLNSIKQKIRG